MAMFFDTSRICSVDGHLSFVSFLVCDCLSMLLDEGVYVRKQKYAKQVLAEEHIKHILLQKLARWLQTEATMSRKQSAQR